MGFQSKIQHQCSQKTVKFQEYKGKKISIQYTNGAVYNGQCKNKEAIKNGTGKLEHEKYQYNGEWRNDEQFGEGCEIIRNDSKSELTYTGLFKNNQKAGEGSLKYESKNRNRIITYQGDFEDDLPNGRGTKIIKKLKQSLIGTDEEQFTGIWENGQMINGIIKYKNGEYYEGETKGELPQKHGKGILYYKSGNIRQIGYFINDNDQQKDQEDLTIKQKEYKIKQEIDNFSKNVKKFLSKFDKIEANTVSQIEQELEKINQNQNVDILNLNLSQELIDEQKVQKLDEILKQQQKIMEKIKIVNVDLSSNGLNDEQIQSLKENFNCKDAQQIELKFDNNELTSNSCDFFTQQLKEITKVKICSINLSGNKIGDQGVNKILEFIKKNEGIQKIELFLEDTQISDESLEKIEQTLTGLKNLTNVNLFISRDNNFSEEKYSSFQSEVFENILNKSKKLRINHNILVW